MGRAWRDKVLNPQAGDRLTRGGVVRLCNGRGAAGSVLFVWWREGAPDKRAHAQQRLACWQKWAGGAAPA